MRSIFLLFSHKLTAKQEEMLKEKHQVESFIYLPKKLQDIWSKIPPDIDTLSEYLSPIKEYLKQNGKKDDIVLIQGDFGAVYTMVNLAFELHLTPIYATTKREIEEHIINDTITKKSIFKFVRFRQYGK